jgi:hypothetical protein
MIFPGRVRGLELHRTGNAVKASRRRRSGRSTGKYTVAVKMAYPYAAAEHAGVQPLSGGMRKSRWLLRELRRWLASYQRSVSSCTRNPTWFGRTSRSSTATTGRSSPSTHPASPSSAKRCGAWRAPRGQISAKADRNGVRRRIGRSLYLIKFGFQPGSPFLDERVRGVDADRRGSSSTNNATSSRTPLAAERAGTAIASVRRLLIDPRSAESVRAGSGSSTTRRRRRSCWRQRLLGGLRRTSPPSAPASTASPSQQGRCSGRTERTATSSARTTRLSDSTCPVLHIPSGTGDQGSTSRLRRSST